MPSTRKPYRRFTARGRQDGGMDALRELTERERTGGNGGGAAPPPRREAPKAPRVPPADLRSRERALERAGRSWWSLRGLGPGGFVLRGLVVLAGFAVVWMLVGYFVVRGSVSDANARISDAAKAKLASDDGMLGSPTNTLILGADAGGGGRPRADTIMVMRTDPDAGRIKFLSIPRDTRIQLGPYGDEKIAHSTRLAGQAGAIGAVRRLTGIPIHHIIIVRFAGFPKLVDEVGGVTVDNPTAITNCPYPGGRTVSFDKGRIDLDGERALEFVRVRKCDDDFARARRQQLFLSGLKSQLVSPWSVWKAPWKGAAVVDTISTDMSVNDLTKFAWLQWRLDQRPEDRYVLAGTPQQIGGVDYVVYDPTSGDEQLRRFMAS